MEQKIDIVYYEIVTGLNKEDKIENCDVWKVFIKETFNNKVYQRFVTNYVCRKDKEHFIDINYFELSCLNVIINDIKKEFVLKRKQQKRKNIDLKLKVFIDHINDKGLLEFLDTKKSPNIAIFLTKSNKSLFLGGKNIMTERRLKT